MEEQEFSTRQEIPEKPVSLWKQAMTYGLYYAVVSIIISIALYAAGAMMAKPVQYISIAVMIAAVVLIQLHYRKTLGGYITYGQSLVIAILSMFLAAIPIAMFTFILYKYIDPGLIDQLRMMAEEKLVEQGKLSQEQIDAALAITSKFQTPLTISLGQIFNLPLMGLIIGLISSIFIKKVEPDKIFE